MAEITISKTIKAGLPRLPFAEMADKVLPKDYELSLVFCADTLSRKLNNEHRGKDTPTNILSFTLDKKTGEIFINLELARRQAKKFDRKPDNFVAFLFIHGLFHLIGLDHGATMERAEEKVRKAFRI
jgi:probable rRNA maturation factor